MLFVPLHPFSTSCHDNPKTRASQNAQRGITFFTPRRSFAGSGNRLGVGGVAPGPDSRLRLSRKSLECHMLSRHRLPLQGCVRLSLSTSATPPLGSRMRDLESVVTRSRVDLTLQTATSVQVCPVNDKKLKRSPQRFGMVPLTNTVGEVSSMREWSSP